MRKNNEENDIVKVNENNAEAAHKTKPDIANIFNLIGKVLITITEEVSEWRWYLWT